MFGIADCTVVGTINDCWMDPCSEDKEPLEEQFLSFMQHLQDLSVGQLPNYRYLQDLLWEVACDGQAENTDRETKEAMLAKVCYDWCTEDCVHKKPGAATETTTDNAKSPSCNCVCRALPKSKHGFRAILTRSVDLSSDENCTPDESPDESDEE